MRLKPEERKAIFRGDYRALKRKVKPQVKAGQKLVLSWTRGGRQVVDRRVGATVDVPRKPNLWIVFKAPELRDGVWVLQYTAHDAREPVRLLGSAPNPSQPGLRTRLRSPDEVKKAGRPKESWTPESERGYGGGKSAVDHLEAVDDTTLAEFAMRARHNRSEFLREAAEEDSELQEEERRRRERALRDLLRETLRGLDPSQQVALLAKIERDIRCAREPTDQAA